MDNIIIDLNQLSKFKLNINEYLIILKIYKLSKMEDIPFYIIEQAFITSLIKKEYIEEKDDNLFVTKKGLNIINLSKNDDITEIIKYFIKITGKTKTSETSQSNRKYINDRLKQGYSKEDLKKVIDVKYKEWKNSVTMNKYIRIETLFNETKFQKYINDVDSVQEVSDNFKSI